MSESVAGLIMILLGGLALVVFFIMCFGPGEVVGLGERSSRLGI